MAVQEATTEDQLKVLKVAEENPDMSPAEVADEINDPHLNTHYCQRIMHDFELPDDHDEDDGIEGPEDVGPVKYRCTVCGDVRDNIEGATAHVQRTSDAQHEDKTPTEHIEVIGEGAEALQELNKRTGAGGVIDDRHLDVLWTLYQHPEQSLNELCNKGVLNMGRSTVRRRLKEMGITSRGTDSSMLTPEMRTEMVIDHLESTGLDLSRDNGGGDDFPIDVTKLPDQCSKDDTDVGAFYWGRVNNKKPYGVFVTISDGPGSTDISGLAHESNFPPLHTHADYDVGDEVIVERLPDRDEDEPESLTFRMLTDGDGELRGDIDTDDGTEETIETDNGTGSYKGPAEGIDATEQYITERPAVGEVQQSEDEEDPEEFAVAEELPEDDDEDPEEYMSADELLDDGDDGEPESPAARIDGVERIEQQIADIGDSIEDVKRVAERAEQDARDAAANAGGPSHIPDHSDALRDLSDRLERVESHVQAAVADEPDEDEISVTLDKDQAKHLIREAPEDIADMILEELAGS